MKPPSLVFIACALALAGCSSASDKPEPAPAPPPAGSVKAPPPEPTETTTVAPTRSATGALKLGGAITGTFEWRKREQKTPISCAWDAAKEIGSFHVDLSDGAGKIVTLGVDVPTTDVGLPRLDVSSKDLPAPLKTSFGFNVSGDDTILITVKFDTKLGDEKKPDLTIKGTLEVSCPRKK